MLLLDDLLATLTHVAPIRSVLVGAHWTAVCSRSCGLASTLMADRPHGLFATRHPSRPRPIGLSVVRLLRRDGNLLEFEGVDVLDGTPLLDIKPYIAELDTKPNANLRWVGEIDDAEHLALHIKGVPHEY